MEQYYEYSHRMDPDLFYRLIDQLHDEILIYDGNYKIVYVNQACSRHYACTPKEMIGRLFFDFVDNGWWSPSILPTIYKEKKAYMVKQRTFTGAELLTIAVPLFNDKAEVEYVLMNVRDEPNTITLWNPNYSHSDSLELKRTPVAESKKMQHVLAVAKRLSQVNLPCIILGESGTGKTMLAQYIHSLSNRQDRPFVRLNCVGIPQESIESDLFGLTKALKTNDDSKSTEGLLEHANYGTLLLDEISELSLSAQTKLLQILQDQVFMPVGGSAHRKIDIRVIATTSAHLPNLVSVGRFRKDLYYRLNGLELFVPALKNHKDDIQALVLTFLKELNAKYNVKKHISEEAMKILIEYDYPGNVRELRHIVERLIITTDEMEINASNLPKNLFGVINEIEGLQRTDYGVIEQGEGDQTAFSNMPAGMSYSEAMAYYEKQLIQSVYRDRGTSRKLADHLSISQTKANNLIQKYCK